VNFGLLVAVGMVKFFFGQSQTKTTTFKLQLNAESVIVAMF